MKGLKVLYTIDFKNISERNRKLKYAFCKKWKKTLKLPFK